MSYYTTDLNIYDIIESDETVEIVVSTSTHQDKIIQLYISSKLSAYEAMGGLDKVSFIVSSYAVQDGLFILAVDAGESQVDYFDDAYPLAATYGDRLNVEILKDLDFSPYDKFRVYLDDVQKHEADLFPNKVGATGFGMYFGGSFGYDAEKAPGWGVTLWGIDEWGINVGFARWKSQALNRGSVNLKVSSLDGIGNESTKYDNDVTINTYARPATSLVINEYDSGTKQLTVTFTPSEDF